MFPMRDEILELWILAETNQIDLFQIHFRGGWARSLPQILDDGWLLVVDGVSRARCANLLRSYQIKSWQVDQGRWANSVCELWLPASGVQINFDLEDGADALIVLCKSEASDPGVTRLCTEFT
jgi:hypothetical protein